MTAPPISSAESFYHRIIEHQNPFEFLSSLTNPVEPTVETEWLEFKREPDRPNRVKEIWSKALSGFANTAGGVLIWGIDSRKNPETGIDGAQSVVLVQNAAEFRSRLMELHHGATDPPVSRVDTRSFVDPSSTGPSGFVVCYIPESGFKPHRAELVTNKPFFIRAGDDFVNPSPALLRTLFYPHSKALIKIEGAPKWRLFQDEAMVEIEFRVLNEGTATARDVLIVLQASRQLNDIVTAQQWSTASTIQGQKAFRSSSPLHPGIVSHLCTVFEQVRLFNNVPAFHSVSLNFLIFIADQVPSRSQMTFQLEDVLNTTIHKPPSEAAR